MLNTWFEIDYTYNCNAYCKKLSTQKKSHERIKISSSTAFIPGKT